MSPRPIEYSNLDKVVTVRVSLMSLSDRDKCHVMEDLLRELAGIATIDQGERMAAILQIAYNYWWNK